MMDQEHYEMAIKFLNGALSMLQWAHDEVIEFAVTGLERQLALQIREQVLNVSRLSNKVINHSRVLQFTAKGDALTAP